MSERDIAEHEDDETVSPYLLRPVRTYDQYLRDLDNSVRIHKSAEAQRAGDGGRTPRASNAQADSRQDRQHVSADNQA